MTQKTTTQDYTQIQLPQYARPWFGQHVYITHGTSGTLRIITEDQYKKLKQGLSELACSDPEIHESEFLESMLASTIPIRISDTGVLHVPAFLDRYLGRYGSLSLVSENQNDGLTLDKKTTPTQRFLNTMIVRIANIKIYLTHDNRDGAR